MENEYISPIGVAYLGDYVEPDMYDAKDDSDDMDEIRNLLHTNMWDKTYTEDDQGNWYEVDNPPNYGNPLYEYPSDMSE